MDTIKVDMDLQWNLIGDLALRHGTDKEKNALIHIRAQAAEHRLQAEGLAAWILETFGSSEGKELIAENSSFNGAIKKLNKSLSERKNHERL